MKKTTKILAVLLTLCLVLGVLCVSVFASDATTNNVISDPASVAQNTIFRADAITMDGINDDAYHAKFDKVSASTTIYDEKYVTVGGNKYMQLRYSGTPYATASSTPYFDWKIGNYFKTDLPNAPVSPSLFNTDYITLEFDIASDAYYSETADENGSHLTDKDTGKLAYVDGFYYGIVARYWKATKDGWGTMTAGADGSLTTAYLDSDGDGVSDAWYLVAGRVEPGSTTTTNSKVLLSDVAGVWNHITVVIDVEYSVSDTAYDFSASKAHVYLDGEFAFDLKKVFGSVAPSNVGSDTAYSYTDSIVMNSIRLQPYNNDQDIIEQDTYSMCFDNFVASFYGDGKNGADYSAAADYTTADSFGLDDIFGTQYLGKFNKNIDISECVDILSNSSDVKSSIREAVASAKSGDEITITTSVDNLAPTADSLTIKCDSAINVALTDEAALKYKVTKTADGYSISLFAANEITTLEWYDANGKIITTEKIPAGVMPSTDKSAGYIDGKTVYYPVVTGWTMDIGGSVRALTADEIAANPVIKITPTVSETKSQANAAFYTGIYYAESGVRPVLDTAGTLAKYSAMSNFLSEMGNAADGSTVVLLTSGHEFTNSQSVTITGKEISLDLNGNTLFHGSVASNGGHDGNPFFKLNEGATFNIYSSKSGAAVYDMTFKSATEIRSRGGFIYVNNGVDEADITIGDFRGFTGRNIEFNTGTLVYVVGTAESATYTGAYLKGGDDITINVGNLVAYDPFYSAYSMFDFLAHDVKLTIRDSEIYNSHAAYSIFHDYADNRTVSSDIKVYNSKLISVTADGAQGKISYRIGPESTIYYEGCTIVGRIANTYHAGCKVIFGKDNVVSTNVSQMNNSACKIADGVIRLNPASGTTQTVEESIEHANINTVLTGAATDSVILSGSSYVINQTEVLKRVTTNISQSLAFATYDPTDDKNLPDIIAKAEWQDANGNVIDTTYDLVGNPINHASLSGIAVSLNNGWYDIGYNGWVNKTEGSDGSLAYVEGKVNVFAPKLALVANLKNVYGNVALYSHMGYSTYIAKPAESANIVFDVKNTNKDEAQQTGFFATNKPTETLTGNNGSKNIVMNGKTISCYFDTVWGNLDSYTDTNRIVRFEVTECEFNGIEGIQDEEKNVYLEQILKVDFMAYFNRVVEIYGCDTDESRLMYSIVALKEEVNKATNTYSDDAKAHLNEFFAKFDNHTDCKCKFSFDDVTFTEEEKAITADSYAALKEQGILAVSFSADINKPTLIIYSTKSETPTVTYKNINGSYVSHTNFSVSSNASYDIDGTMCYKITVNSIPAVSLSQVFNISYGGATGQYSLATYITNNPTVNMAKLLYTYSKATINYRQETEAELNK